MLRRRIDEMPNEQYQSLFGASEEVVRDALLEALGPERRAPAGRLLDRYAGGARSPRLATSAATTSATSSTALRGRARRAASGPTVIFAYTIKGYGLEIAGRPQNHSALLTGDQIDELRASSA